jgi:hypothetical protein
MAKRCRRYLSRPYAAQRVPRLARVASPSLRCVLQSAATRAATRFARLRPCLANPRRPLPPRNPTRRRLCPNALYQQTAIRRRSNVRPRTTKPRPVRRRRTGPNNRRGARFPKRAGRSSSWFGPLSTARGPHSPNARHTDGGRQQAHALRVVGDLPNQFGRVDDFHAKP